MAWSRTRNSRPGGALPHTLSQQPASLSTHLLYKQARSHTTRRAVITVRAGCAKKTGCSQFVQKVFLPAQHAGFLYSCNSENDKGLIYQRAAQGLYGNLKATCYDTNAPIYLCPFIRYYLQLLFPGGPTIECPTSTVIRLPFIFPFCAKELHNGQVSAVELYSPILSYSGLSTWKEITEVQLLLPFASFLLRVRVMIVGGGFVYRLHYTDSVVHTAAFMQLLLVKCIKMPSEHWIWKWGEVTRCICLPVGFSFDFTVLRWGARYETKPLLWRGWK